MSEIEESPIEDTFEADVEAAKLMEEVLNNFKGPKALQTALSKPKKIKTFINALKKFRKDNALEIENLDSALNLLDMHGVARSDFTKQASIDLSQVLLERIQELGQESITYPFTVLKLEDFLKKIFKLHRLKLIRPLVIEILQHLNSIPDEYVDEIAANEDLYAECSVPILRHVWLKHHNMFYNNIKPVMRSYYRSKTYELFSVEPSKTNYFTSTSARERRQNPEVQKLVEMIGQEARLYKLLLNWIRVSYAETGDISLCTLRAELIMAAHDTSNEKFTRLDPCHELAWCLDVCIRDKGMDSNHGAKIKSILDVCFMLDPLIVGDLAMICADPHAMHFLAGFIVRKLRDTAQTGLPRDTQSVNLAVRILAFGLHAQTIVKTKVIPGGMIDTIFFTQFLTCLTACMLEDFMVAEEFKDPETGELAYVTPVPDLILKFVKVDRLAAMIYIHYVTELLPTKGRTFNKQILDRYAPYLPYLTGHMAIEGIWGYFFIDRVIAATSRVQFLIDEHYWLKLLMEILLFPRIVNSEDPIVRMNHMRLIYIIGYCWGVEPCREMFCKFNKLPLEGIKPTSLSLEMYAMAHQKVMDCLWPKPPKPMPAPEGICANGHFACVYQCTAQFVYGDSPDFAHRLDEYLSGFEDPKYPTGLDMGLYKYDDDREDFYHLVPAE